MDARMTSEAQSLMLNGNALAGLLRTVFNTEMTIAPLECAGCGRVGEMGSL